MNENYVTLGQVCDKGSSNIAQKDLAEREGQYPIYGAAGLIKNVDFAHQKQPYIAVVKDGAGIGRVMKLPAYSSVIGTMQYIFPKENVDIDYLFYALQHMNLGKYFSGSTIPHIYFRDYQKERLKLPVMEVQQRQADTLSRIDALSAYGQRQIALMDEIVKSRFVEIFGDPISHLDRGETKQLDRIAERITVGFVGEASNDYVEAGVPYLRTQNVRVNHIDLEGLIYVNESFHKKNSKSIIRPGDIVISRVGANRGMAAVIPESLPEANIANCLIVGRTNLIDSCYLAFYLNMSYGKRPQFGASVGSAQGVVNTSVLKKWEIYVPEKKEQKEFVEYVNQVDKSKLAVKQSLEKLEALKKSLMQQYFG